MPIIPTDKELYRAKLEKEERFFRATLKPLGDYYHEILRNYGRDRGFSSLVGNLEYVVDNFGSFKDILIESKEDFPSNEKLLDIYKECWNGLEEIKKIIKESEKDKVLMPEDFVRVMYLLGNVRILMDFSYALTLLRRKILVEEKSARKVLDNDKYKKAIFAFLKKMKENSNYEQFYMGDEASYSMVTLVVVDAEDNSLLRNLLTQKGNEKELLRSYIPERGLKRVLFEKRSKVEEMFREALRHRKEKQKMCLPKNLASRVDYKKFRNYVNQLYPETSTYII
jgi:hypothetical protein